MMSSSERVSSPMVGQRFSEPSSQFQSSSGMESQSQPGAAFGTPQLSGITSTEALAGTSGISSQQGISSQSGIQQPSTSYQSSQRYPPQSGLSQQQTSTTEGYGAQQPISSQTQQQPQFSQQQTQVPLGPSVQQQGITEGVSSRLAPGQMPHMTTVLITGATGSTGTAVLQLMDTYKKNYNLVVGVHAESPQELSQKRQILSSFDRLIQLDAEHVQTLDFRGIDILFIIPPNSPNRVQQVSNYVKAAKTHAVKYIILLSVLGTDDPTSDFAQNFQQIENIVEDSEIPCTFLRCNFYMENLFLQAPVIASQNCITLPLQNGRWAPISVQDVAKAVCAIIRYPEPHLNKAYDLTGPELLYGNDIADIASECLGRRIVFNNCDHQSYCSLLCKQGVPEWLAAGMCNYFSSFASNRRLDQVDSGSFFRDLTGDQLITLREWFAKNRQVFEARMEQFGNVIPQQQQQQQQQPSVSQPQSFESGRPIRGTQQVSPQEVSTLADEFLEVLDNITRDYEDMSRRNERRIGHLFALKRRLGSGLSSQQQQPSSVSQQQPWSQQESGVSQERPGVSQQVPISSQQQQPFSQSQQPFSQSQQPFSQQSQQPISQQSQQQPWQSQAQPQQSWQQSQPSSKGGMLGNVEPWSQKSIGGVQATPSSSTSRMGLGENLYNIYRREYGAQ